MITREAIIAASNELAKKSMQDINTETARLWAARACAAFELWRNAFSMGDESSSTWYLMACEFEHEAREHASLTDDPSLLDEVKVAIHASRNFGSGLQQG